jgi:uncharacterized membrane protein
MNRVPVGPPIWIILGPILVLLVIALLVPLFVRTGQRPSDSAWTGVFYYNPDDPALLVPKRFGIGYTINFGHRWAWLILVFIVLIVALPLVLIRLTMPQLH